MSKEIQSEKDFLENIGNSEEDVYTFDQNCFGLVEEDDGEIQIHSGNEDETSTKSKASEIFEDAYNQTFEPRDEPEDEPAVPEYLKKEYIALEGGRFFGKTYCFEELDAAAEKSGISFDKYCERNGIVSITPLTNNDIEVSEVVHKQIDMANPDQRRAVANLLSDTINLAGFPDSLGGLDFVRKDMTEYLIKAQRLGKIHKDSKPTDQEIAGAENFIKRIYGRDNYDVRQSAIEAIKNYFKRKS